MTLPLEWAKDFDSTFAAMSKHNLFGEGSVIVVHLPIRTVSEANNREHWRTKHKRSKLQREVARLAMYNYRRNMHLLPRIHVTLTRIGVRKLDDDNLARSFKAVRDGIADAIGIDDGSDKYTWSYAQERGEPKEYAVRVEITI